MTEPTRATIRRPLLTGRQTIAGLWFPAERFTIPERIHLLLAYWSPGCQAHRFDDGDVLQFASPRQLDCNRLEGWPLLRLGTTLCSALLEDRERAELAQVDLWLVRGSQVETRQLSQARKLELQAWINIDDYTLLDTYDCSQTLQVPELGPETIIRDIREILGDAVAPASPERDEMMRALQRRQQDVSHKALATSTGAASQHQSSIGKVIGYMFIYALVMLVVISTISHLSQSAQAPEEPQAVSSPEENTPPPSIPAIEPDTVSGVPLEFLISAVAIALIIVLIVLTLVRRGRVSGQAGWTSGTPQGRQRDTAAAAKPLPRRASPVTPQRWRNWLASLANATGLSKAFGWRQALYMRRVLAMFEKGDIEEALRHAIPLGDELGDLGQAFGTPGRRASLALGQTRGGTSSISFTGNFDQYLRALYRANFEKLDRAGRIDEAVFVLAELLNDKQEALDYLEKHQRFQQAASLALAWDRPAATIVRLHCLAGDWERAIYVARRDNAFAEALPMLQDKWPDAANRLRLEWAEMLGARGEWLDAVEVVWNLPQERERAVQWLRHAERAGGGLSARALVKRAMLLPDTLEFYAEYLTQLRDDTQRYRDRTAMVRALCLVHRQTKGRTQDQLDALGQLARVLISPALEDHASNRAPLENNDLQTLIAVSRDELLQIDLPKKLPRKMNARLVDMAVAAQWRAPDAGRQAILDAVPLHDDRSLLALGEGGALVIGPEGQSLFRFAVPTYQIVIGESRLTALAIARRDQVWRISKLDLVNRTATDLGVLNLDFHAREFDGTNWVIALGNQIRVVDVDKAFATTWHVKDLPGRVRVYKRFPNEEQWLIGDDMDTLEVWSYALPSRLLRRREPVTRSDSPRLFGPAGQLIEISFIEDAHGKLDLQLSNPTGYRRLIPIPALDTEQRLQLDVRFEDTWLLLGLPQKDQSRQWQFFSNDNRVRGQRAYLDWPACEAMGFRIVDTDLLAFDSSGRLFRVDLATCRTSATQIG